MRIFLKQILMAVVAAALLLPALPVVSEAGVVAKRQHSQQARIHQGVRSGELTRREAHSLQRQQAHIQHAKLRAKRDGVVTPAERGHLDHLQDRASNHIARAKHNDRDRN